MSHGEDDSADEGRDSRLRSLDEALREQAIDAEVPSEDPDVRFIPGLGHVWLYQRDDASWWLIATSARHRDDWVTSPARQFPAESAALALAEALEWLRR